MRKRKRRFGRRTKKQRRKGWSVTKNRQKKRKIAKLVKSLPVR